MTRAERSSLDVLTDRVDIGLTVARKRRVLARDDADLHVLVHIERNGDNTWTVELVADHARTHRVAVEAHGQVEQRRTVAHADILAALKGRPNKKGDEVEPLHTSNKLYHTLKESRSWSRMLDVGTIGALNDAIASGRGEQIILLQEALMEERIGSLAAQIAAKKGIKFVMIAGPSSSGKTTFSNRLSIQLLAKGRKPHPISLDDYYDDRERCPRDADGNLDFECLEALDVRQFNEDMTRLLAGEKVDMPSFNFKTGKREYRGRTLQLKENDILVIEGIHGLNDKLSYTLPAESKFKIYISALTQLNIDEHNPLSTTDCRLLRRIVRDARTRGTTAQETIAMWKSVRRGEEKNIFPFQDSADVMFNSALLYEVAVLKVYAEPLLFQIPRDSAEYLEAKRLLKFLDYFLPLPTEGIAQSSLVREFVGGSCFNV